MGGIRSLRVKRNEETHWPSQCDSFSARKGRKKKETKRTLSRAKRFLKEEPALFVNESYSARRGNPVRAIVREGLSKSCKNIKTKGTGEGGCSGGQE